MDADAEHVGVADLEVEVAVVGVDVDDPAGDRVDGVEDPDVVDRFEQALGHGRLEHVACEVRGDACAVDEALADVLEVIDERATEVLARVDDAVQVAGGDRRTDVHGRLGRCGDELGARRRCLGSPIDGFRHRVAEARRRRRPHPQCRR